MAPLPKPWLEKVSKSQGGLTYYFHSGMGESLCDRPMVGVDGDEAWPDDDEGDEVQAQAQAQAQASPQKYDWEDDYPDADADADGASDGVRTAGGKS